MNNQLSTSIMVGVTTRHRKSASTAGKAATMMANNSNNKTTGNLKHCAQYMHDNMLLPMIFKQRGRMKLQVAASLLLFSSLISAHLIITKAAEANSTMASSSATLKQTTSMQSPVTETTTYIVDQDDKTRNMSNKSAPSGSGAQVQSTPSDVEQQRSQEASSSSSLASVAVSQKQDKNITVSSGSDEQVYSPNNRAVPVLRPSIEEEASELSKKHLNLEHENWRLKQSSASGASLQLQQQARHLPLDGSSLFQVLSATGRGGGGDGSNEEVVIKEEQDISMTSDGGTGNSSGGRQATSVSALLQQQQETFFGVKTNEQYPSNVDSSAATLSSQPRKYQHRRRKGNVFQQNYYEDNELHQCHLYLQHHNSPPPFQTSSAPNEPVSFRFSRQPIPCACELRGHFAAVTSEGDQQDSVWLSCDNVQLIGSHFYPQSSGVNVEVSSTSETNSTRNATGDHYQTDRGFLMTRFSQRSSGLQILHAQKFHYLQLFHLKTIDLSGNKIRQIKMDAFHGLEGRLEHLNLANNLLGDSRAIFDNAQNLNIHRTTNSNNNVNGKLIFLSDELNRLRKLKWLSLRNNQVNQLGPSIFIKQPVPAATATAPTSLPAADSALPIDSSSFSGSVSDLEYLDLSENLLKFIPSDSIHLLNKLQTLNLRRNRIAQLDQFSNFPKSLKYLDLSENLIRNVRQCNLIDLPNLIEINLSHNQLSHLAKTAFVSSSVSLLNNLVLSPGLTEEGALMDDTSPNKDDQSLVVSDDGRPLMTVSEHGGSAKEEEDDKSGKSNLSRLRRDVKDTGELEELSSGNVEVDDLEADESFLSSISSHASSKQAFSDELNSIQQTNQFNSTLRLNLSYNFFEHIPGDSLLKFPNLQSLDLSFNRIRRLDSNYLCSIYNLVDNLQHLDLSGNLLYISQNTTTNEQGSGGGGQTRQLNRIFGCLQKLEKLFLSTNRLAAIDYSNIKAKPPVEPSIPLPSSSSTTNLRDEDLQVGESSINEKIEAQHETLVIRFGEGIGSRRLNTLDLSDNQLKSMPIIEQVSHQPPVLLNSTTDVNATTNHQSQLNQWISSCFYLEVLNLNFNYLERLEEHEFEHLYSLRQLSLDFNKLSVLPVNLMRKFTSLDRLSLNGNRISSLDPLNELLERSARTLRVLNLANNRLLAWPQLNKQSIKGTGNNNQEINQGPADTWTSEDKQAHMLTFALEELNLEGNLLTSNNVTSLFDQLAYMRALKTLNLNYNLLNKIKSEWFKFANKNLQKLLLTGNKINNIELGSFASNQVNELTQLTLDYNLLKELKRKTFDSLPKLRELNLAYNLIHTINSETFHQVNSLQILKLNNNKLTSWKCEYFSNLCNSITGNINADLATLLSTDLHVNEPVPNSVSSLIELDLSHNSLSQLRTNSISVHTKLVKLNLAHNKLSFIPHNLFKATTSGSKTSRQIQLVSSLKYLNLAYNRIQTIDNINFKPLKNLLSLDLSYNELQTLGIDVVLMDSKALQNDQSNRRLIVSNNLTNLLLGDEMYNSNQTSGGSYLESTAHWPALGKLRHLNFAHNQLTLVNQSLLSELSPFALLNLNLSANYLESEALPSGFYTKMTGTSRSSSNQGSPDTAKQTNYDLVFTLKLESLDLSYNRLNEYPIVLLDNHYTSMESCDLSHNRIQNLIANSNLMLHIKNLNLDFNPLNRDSCELVLFEQRNVRSLNLAATRLHAIQQATDMMSHGAQSGQLRYRLANQTSELDLIRSISRPINAPYLRYLNLSSNQLVWLAANVFDKIHSLQVLDLSNNQLTRLHLLNNQLSHVSSTLDYLNMGSNLFTNIDVNDLSQLSKLQHLDLSNLLSLQKMNCKFLSKLTTLKTLKMFNYPQLRATLISTMTALKSDTGNFQPSERLRRKLREELIMSTIGKHCFRDESLYADYIHEPVDFPRTSEMKWFNIEELELELFNNFEDKLESVSAYKLTDELSQLLGPYTRKVTLIGLNLTTIGDNSLIGISGDELKLKISYTSMSQLPLRQILSGVTKRTKLDLDFRNNNIQMIDTISLQMLDELRLNNQLLRNGDYSTLKLASNPIRCDCQTRPLWLWLNQRWMNVELPQSGGEDQPTEHPIVNNMNHWLKFNTIPYTNDLKCHYPLKLRGKSTQHVYYNDLVCKGSSQQAAPSTTSRQSRRRNDTNYGESYYSTAYLSDAGEGDDLEEDDYYDPDAKVENVVKLTRFNRYRQSSAKASLPSISVAPFLLPSSQERERELLEEEASRIGKRDQNSVTKPPMVPANSFDIDNRQASTNYNKHRPNTYQKHSHFDTLNAFNQIPLGKAFAGGRAHNTVTKHALLTESDIAIVTVISIAMAIMSFFIIAICLFKHRMDKTDKDQILSTHNKLLMSHAMFINENKFVPKPKPKQELTSSKSSGSQVSKVCQGTKVRRIALPSDRQCHHCKRHISAAHQTKIRYLAHPIQDKLIPATNLKISECLAQRKKTAEVEKSQEMVEQVVSNQQVNNQSDTPEETNNKLEQHCVVPPNLIKALVRQLDQQEEARYQVSREQHMKHNSSYHSREQQVLSMRTFGVNAQASSNSFATRRNPPEAEANLESQLPTNHVDGRFTYQTESQTESPAFEVRLNRVDRPDSQEVSNHEDVFILMGNSPSSVREIGRLTPMEQRDIVQNQGISTLSGQSMMVDECSRSSSPVAYGFMRSSPATTMSSHTTMTQNHYVVNNAPEDLSNLQRFVAVNVATGGMFSSSQDNNTISDNNNTEFLIDAKSIPVTELLDEDQNRSNDANGLHEDQVIMSRL